MKLYVVGLSAWLALSGGCASSSSGPGKGRQGAETISEQIMARYDTNRDGRITTEEASAARIQRFDRADLDKDGQLTASEASQLNDDISRAGRGGRMARQRSDPFTQLDVNGDSSISRSEFEASDSQLLARADLNGDGVVERSEIDALIERFRGRSG